MKELLISKLYSYLLDNHLDLLIALQEDHRLTPYLETKVGSVRELWEGLESECRPAYVVEALCLEELTRDLRPSRFNYMRDLLETEFDTAYRRWNKSGILAYEVINLIGACEPIFEVFGFGGESEDSRQLKYAIMGMVEEYLEQ